MLPESKFVTCGKRRARGMNYIRGKRETCRTRGRCGTRRTRVARDTHGAHFVNKLGVVCMMRIVRVVPCGARGKP